MVVYGISDLHCPELEVVQSSSSYQKKEVEAVPAAGYLKHTLAMCSVALLFSGPFSVYPLETPHPFVYIAA